MNLPKKRLDCIQTSIAYIVWHILLLKVQQKSLVPIVIVVVAIALLQQYNEV